MSMSIRNYLQSCVELVRLCSRSGWIDNGTLRYRILDEEAGAVIAMVEFEEIVAVESGGTGTRVPCQGRVRLHLDPIGQVCGIEFL